MNEWYRYLVGKSGKAGQLLFRLFLVGVALLAVCFRRTLSQFRSLPLLLLSFVFSRAVLRLVLVGGVILASFVVTSELDTSWLVIGWSSSMTWEACTSGAGASRE